MTERDATGASDSQGGSDEEEPAGLTCVNCGIHARKAGPMVPSRYDPTYRLCLACSEADALRRVGVQENCDAGDALGDVLHKIEDRWPDAAELCEEAYDRAVAWTAVCMEVAHRDAAAGMGYLNGSVDPYKAPENGVAFTLGELAAEAGARARVYLRACDGVAVPIETADLQDGQVVMELPRTLEFAGIRRQPVEFRLRSIVRALDALAIDLYGWDLKEKRQTVEALITETLEKIAEMKSLDLDGVRELEDWVGRARNTLDERKRSHRSSHRARGRHRRGVAGWN